LFAIFQNGLVAENVQGTVGDCRGAKEDSPLNLSKSDFIRQSSTAKTVQQFSEVIENGSCDHPPRKKIMDWPKSRFAMPTMFWIPFFPTS
jgi:hypothetical protein